MDRGDDSTRKRFACNPHLELAFLAITQREIGIGRKQEIGSSVLLEVIIRVGHARFLGAAEDHANIHRELASLAGKTVTPEAQCVEAHQERPLVVGNTASEQDVALAREGKADMIDEALQRAGLEKENVSVVVYKEPEGILDALGLNVQTKKDPLERFEKAASVLAAPKAYYICPNTLPL